MKPALLITGVPGSGKSTISRLLAENLGAKHIEVTKFAITEKEIIDVDDKRETLIVNLESLKEKLVRTLLNSKKLTIIDSHFSPELIPTNFIEKLIVLRRAPWEIKEVLEKRGYNKGKILENIQAEIVGVCLHDALSLHPREKICEIDITDRSPNEVIKEIILILRGIHASNVYKKDWGTYQKTLESLEALKST